MGATRPQCSAKLKHQNVEKFTGIMARNAPKWMTSPLTARLTGDPRSNR